MRDARSAELRDWATRLFVIAVDAMATVESPRAQAFVMLGAGAVLDVDPDHLAARAILTRFGDRLQTLMHTSRRPDWAWFEAVLAYDNARLPEALLVAGNHLDRRDLIESGLATLDWIARQQQTPEGYRAVGSESFGRVQKPPLPYDQQPLEAQATIDAAIAASMVDPDPRWLALAVTAYRWFLGQNDLDAPLATCTNSGCYDGLTPHGPNNNQGAESLLALQLASCAMSKLYHRFPNMSEQPSKRATVLLDRAIGETVFHAADTLPLRSAADLGGKGNVSMSEPLQDSPNLRN